MARQSAKAKSGGRGRRKNATPLAGSALLQANPAPPAANPAPPSATPAPPDAKDIIARVNDISGYAKGTWFALLGVLVFSGITLLGVEDADFFAAESKTDLPLVNVSVPVTYFFGAGAALVTAVYVYFHLYLELLWGTLGKAPAQLDGQPLSERISPWLIGEWALRRRDWLALRVARRQGQSEPPASAARRALAWIGSLMSLFFVWLFGPLVLFYFWWRSMPAHIDWMTVLLGLVLAFGLWTGWRSWRAATRLLAGQPSCGPFVDKSRLWRARLRSATGFGVFALVLTVISLVRTGSVLLPGEHPLARHYGMGKKAEWIALFKELNESGYPAKYWDRRWGEAKTAAAIWHYFADRLHTDYLRPSVSRADLYEAQIVAMPKDWLSRDEAERVFRADWAKQEELAYRDPFTQIPERNVEADFQRELAEARATTAPGTRGNSLPTGPATPDLNENAFRADWAKRERLTLTKPFLAIAERNPEVEFQTVWGERRKTYLATQITPRLDGFNLRNAYMTRAFLPGVLLRRANLEGAKLGSAILEGTNLRGARLEGAILNNARLMGADLEIARLENAALSGAILDGANLSFAKLTAATLHGVRLEGANIRFTTLDRADLRGARLFGSNGKNIELRLASIKSANFDIAAFRNANISAQNLIEMRNFRSSFGDSSVTLFWGSVWPCHWQVNRIWRSLLVLVGKGLRRFANRILEAACH